MQQSMLLNIDKGYKQYSPNCLEIQETYIDPLHFVNLSYIKLMANLPQGYGEGFFLVLTLVSQTVSLMSMKFLLICW